MERTPSKAGQPGSPQTNRIPKPYKPGLERDASGWLHGQEVRGWQAPISVGYNLLKENIKIKIRS